MKKIKVIQFGLGAMGSEMAKIVLEKKELELVGAIVRSDEDDGKDIGELIGLKKKIGIKASNKPEEFFKKTKADIVLHATVSYALPVWKQIEPAVKSGINVITIAEEMNYPFKRHKSLSKKIDRAAKKHNARVIGTGINPGFMMDLLLLILSGLSKQINSIKVTRSKCFTPLSESIKKNIGLNLSSSEFKRKVKSRELVLHVGLEESMHMLADGLGLNIDKVVETKEPVPAKHFIRVSKDTVIKKGKVSGFNHRCFGYKKGKKIITLEELGRTDPHEEYYNEIKINGRPNIKERMNIPPRNISVASHAVNLIPKVLDSKPGLLSMLDLPVASALSPK